MFVRIAAITTLSAVALLGCGSTTTESDVDQAWSELSQTDKQDLCNAYDLFGDEVIEVMIAGLNETEDGGLSSDERDLFLDKIVEECS